MNYIRPIITYGNDFSITINMKRWNNTEFIDFDLDQAADLRVFLTCSKHATEIDITDYQLDGSVINCHIDYRLLHINASYGITVEGYYNDQHFRWAMLPKEGFLVVSNTSAQNTNDAVDSITLNGLVGWGNSFDTTLYYTKEEADAKFLTEEDTYNFAEKSELKPIVFKQGNNISTGEVARGIMRGAEIFMEENDGATLSLSEYSLNYDNTKGVYMKFETHYVDPVSLNDTLNTYIWRSNGQDDFSDNWEYSETTLGNAENVIINWRGVIDTTYDESDTNHENPIEVYSIPEHTWGELQQETNALKMIHLTFYYRVDGVINWNTPIYTFTSTKGLFNIYFSQIVFGYEPGFLPEQFKLAVLDARRDNSDTSLPTGARPIKLTPHITDMIQIESDIQTLTETKQVKLQSGVNIKSINNQSILGSGNITIQDGGGEQVQADWDEEDSESVSYIQNKPDLDDMQKVIANALCIHEAAINKINPKLTKVEQSLESTKNEINDSVNNKINDLSNSLDDQLYTIGQNLEIHNEKLEDIKDGVDNAVTELEELINAKQDKLTSGVNIKTVNGRSLLGSGNIIIQGGGDGGEQVQADWDEEDSESVSYIQNKPDLDDMQKVIGNALYIHEAAINKINPKLTKVEQSLESTKNEINDSVNNKINDLSNSLDDQLYTIGQNLEIHNEKLEDIKNPMLLDDNDNYHLASTVVDNTYRSFIWGHEHNISGGDWNTDCSFINGWRNQVACLHTGFINGEENIINSIGTTTSVFGIGNKIRNTAWQVDSRNKKPNFIFGCYNEIGTILGPTTEEGGDDWNTVGKTLIGNNLHIEGSRDPMLIIGRYNKFHQGTDYSSRDQGLFMVGCGWAEAQRANAFVIDTIGNIYMKPYSAGTFDPIYEDEDGMINVGKKLKELENSVRTKYYVKIDWELWPQTLGTGDAAIYFKQLTVYKTTTGEPVDKVQFSALDTLEAVLYYIQISYNIYCSITIDDRLASITDFSWRMIDDYYLMDINQTIGGYSIGYGSVLQLKFYEAHFTQSTIIPYYCNDVVINLMPGRNRMVTSSTSGLKIELVSALPNSPDANTIYLIQ